MCSRYNATCRWQAFSSIPKLATAHMQQEDRQDNTRDDFCGHYSRGKPGRTRTMRLGPAGDSCLPPAWLSLPPSCEQLGLLPEERRLELRLT